MTSVKKSRGGVWRRTNELEQGCRCSALQRVCGALYVCEGPPEGPWSLLSKTQAVCQCPLLPSGSLWLVGGERSGPLHNSEGYRESRSETVQYIVGLADWHKVCFHSSSTIHVESSTSTADGCNLSWIRHYGPDLSNGRFGRVSLPLSVICCVIFEFVLQPLTSTGSFSAIRSLCGSLMLATQACLGRMNVLKLLLSLM